MALTLVQVGCRVRPSTPRESVYLGDSYQSRDLVV